MLFLKEILIICLIYYWLITVSLAAEIKVKQCNRGREYDVRSEVHSVRISPCPTGGMCELYKGTNATITVRFTPSEEESKPKSKCKLKSKLVWVSKIEMDFGGISADACDYLDCPLAANQEAVFNATFFVSKKWPTGTYPLKLKVMEKSGSGSKPVYFCKLFKVYVTDQPGEVTLT